MAVTLSRDRRRTHSATSASHCASRPSTHESRMAPHSSPVSTSQRPSHARRTQDRSPPRHSCNESTRASASHVTARSVAVLKTKSPKARVVWSAPFSTTAPSTFRATRGASFSRRKTPKFCKESMRAASAGEPAVWSAGVRFWDDHVPPCFRSSAPRESPRWATTTSVRVTRQSNAVAPLSSSATKGPVPPRPLLLDLTRRGCCSSSASSVASAFFRDAAGSSLSCRHRSMFAAA